MADVKISALTAVVTPATTDVVAVVQGGVTKQATVAQLKTAMASFALAGDASGTTAAVVNDQARGLKSATTTVSVSAATAPTSGEVLTATSSTTATWQAPIGIAGVCTLEQFGAVGDGVTSDQAAFAAAVAAITATTYRSLALGAKTYLVTGAQTLPANSSVYGRGASSILKTATNSAVIIIGGEDVELSEFVILGSGAGASQVGVKVGSAGSAGSGYQRLSISNVVFNALGADGFQYNENPLTSTYIGPRLSNCLALLCATGFRMGTRGEYVAFSNCNADACTTGVYVGAGNVSWTGGNIVSNVTGVNLAVGTNDSHGMFVGANINHNTSYSVDAGAITAGHTFSGCHIYGGILRLVSSAGVQFIGCEIDQDEYVLTGAAGTRFDTCIFPSGYVNLLSSSGGATTWWTNARTLLGVFPTFIAARQPYMDADGTNCYLGTDRALALFAPTMRIYALNDTYLGINGNGIAYYDANTFRFVKPRIGLASAYGSDGVGIQAMADANQTPASDVYCYGTIKTTGSNAAERDLTLPAATDAAAYHKVIDCSCTTNGVRVKDSGAGTTVSVAVGEKAVVLMDSRGATKVSSSVSGGSSTGASGQIQTSDGASGFSDGGFNVTTDTSTWGSTSPVKAVKARLSTTDATLTTLATYAIPSSTIVDFQIVVVGIRTGGVSGTAGDSYRAEMPVTYQRIGAAGPTLVGAAYALLGAKSNGGGSAYLPSLDISSNDLRVRVTGVATTNINWTVTIQGQECT